MSQGDLTRVAAPSAAEAARVTPLGDAATALLAGDPTPHQYLDALTAAGLLPDAVQFLAHALPKREGVWWACLCARRALAGATPVDAEAALLAAVRWAAEPDEANRRAAGQAAQAAGVGTPAGLAAMAAFWSGGSLGPPDLPEIPPADHLTARGVAGSVLIAAVSTGPEKAEESLRRNLGLGRDVASGANRWPETAPAVLPSTQPAVATTPAPAPRPITKVTRRLDNWE